MSTAPPTNVTLTPAPPPPPATDAAADAAELAAMHRVTEIFAGMDAPTRRRIAAWVGDKWAPGDAG